MKYKEHSKLREKMVILGKIALTIINVVAAAASIIGLIYNITNNISTGTIVFICAGIVCILAIVSAIGVHLSTKNDRVYLGKTYSKCFHALMHNIRNMLEDDDMAQEKTSYNSATAYRYHITQQSIDLMTELSKHLTEAFNIEIRSCIKLFDFITPGAIKPTDDNIDTAKLKVITFARNNIGLPEMLREQYRTFSVKENTDFDYIFSHKQTDSEYRPAFFFKQDLVKFDKDEKKRGRKYRNSTLNWKDKYRTTIVMPIRYLKDLQDGTVPSYDLVGYLCVDSKNTKAFASGYTTFILELLKGIADILYHYFDGCTQYYEELRDKDEVNKSATNANKEMVGDRA